jgi:hypothetical protein
MIGSSSGWRLGRTGGRASSECVYSSQGLSSIGYDRAMNVDSRIRGTEVKFKRSAQMLSIMPSHEGARVASMIAGC